MSTTKEEVVHVEHPKLDSQRDLESPGKRQTNEEFVISNSEFHSSLNELSFWKSVWLFRKAVFFCVVGSFGALSDNFQLSVPGQILAMPGFVDTFGIPQPDGTKVLPPSRVSAWGGILTAGSFVTVLIGSFWAPHDRFGRKPILYCVQVFMMAACLVEMFTSHWGVWAFAKFLNGISVGLNQQVATTYVSEMSPVTIRGAMLNFYSVWWGVGGFGCAVAMQIVSDLPASKWRHIIYSEWVFSGLSLICMFLVPETPRWYSTKDRHQQAKEQLGKIYRSCQGYDVELEYSILRKEIEDGRILAREQSRVPIITLFRGTNLRRTLISTWPFAWQMWLGVPIIFSYISYFFKLAGLQKPFLATVAINTVYIVALVVSIPLVEVIGRRPLLLVCGVIMVACLIGISALDHFIMDGSQYGTGLVALACLWMAVYSISAGPLGYVYLAEVSTVLLRAKTISVALVVNQLQQFFGTYAVPYMLNGKNFGITGTAAFFGGGAAIGWVLVYLYIPETRGRSYVELDELFERHIPARQFATTQTSVDLVRRDRSEQEA